MLSRRYPPGRVPLLCQAQLQALRAELDKPSGFSSYGQIQQFIADTYQVEMSYKAVYSLIHDRWQAKLKVKDTTLEYALPASLASISNLGVLDAFTFFVVYMGLSFRSFVTYSVGCGRLYCSTLLMQYNLSEMVL